MARCLRDVHSCSPPHSDENLANTFQLRWTWWWGWDKSARNGTSFLRVHFLLSMKTLTYFSLFRVKTKAFSVFLLWTFFIFTKLTTFSQKLWFRFSSWQQHFWRNMYRNKIISMGLNVNEFVKTPSKYVLKQS